MRSAAAQIRPRIVLFGDSITQLGFGQEGALGWASLLSSAYSRRADVFVRGYSGYNTRHALDVLPAVLGGNCGGNAATEGRTLFWTVFFGANDAALPGMRQHVPVSEYGANARKMVNMIRESITGDNDEKYDGKKLVDMPIILITPPPVHEQSFDKWCNDNGRDKSKRTKEAAREYGAMLKSVGAELGCPVLDAFQLIGGDREGFETHLTDGLHLTGSGNALIYDGLMDLIMEDFPHLAPMEDGDGRYGSDGIPLEEKLWTELC